MTDNVINLSERIQAKLEAELSANVDAVLLAKGAAELSMRIRPLLAGRHPGVQSAVLADLLSMWFAGHHPTLRNEMLRQFFNLVIQLIPESEKEIFGDDGFPAA